MSVQPSELATGWWPPDSATDPHRQQQVEVLVDLTGCVRGIRRFGSAAVDLCDVAAGSTVHIYECGVHLSDVAAVALIAREWGATVGGIDTSEIWKYVVLAASAPPFTGH